MADHLDGILFDLSDVLAEHDHQELVERVRAATHLATVETILRMSFKSPDGGAEFRRRVFEVNRK